MLSSVAAEGEMDVAKILYRGEVEGASSSLNTLRTTTDYLDKKKVRVIVQYADERHPDMPDVPTPIEAVSSPEDKAAMRFYTSSGSLGRALFTAPGVPAERVAELAREAVLLGVDALDVHLERVGHLLR